MSTVLNSGNDEIKEVKSEIKESKCAACNRSLNSYRVVEGKKYCIYPCARNVLKICAICKVEKKTGEFPDCWFEHCSACEGKRAEDYGSIVSPRIMEIFEKFKLLYPRYRDAKIPNDGEFKSLKKELANNLTSGYWAQRFIGIQKNKEISNGRGESKNKDIKDIKDIKENIDTVLDNIPLFFDVKQAKELWEIITTSVEEYNVYRFIHALGPSLLLARHMIELHGVWRYYSGAKTEEQIIKQWLNKWEFVGNCERFSIGDCGICLEDIWSTGMWAICKLCQQNSHIPCKLNYLKGLECKVNSYTCEYCRQSYKNDDDVILHKYRLYRQLSDVLVPLSWKDHLLKM